MPNASYRPCAEPGCSALVYGQRRCPTHTRTAEHRKGSRITRGYDKDWLRLRAWFMRQPGHQLCVLCMKEGRVTRTAEVDHIVPFRGLHDPNRLDPRNLQPLCIPHHRMKTSQGGVAKCL
jgi:5-methylcytosine-specific restriction protein A